MSESFTSSNGWQVDKHGDLVEVGGFGFVDSRAISAIEQFFTERRDHELGRWRDTMEPHVVCYSRGRDYVRVTSERSGEYWEFERGKVVAASTAECVAERYFQAHPIRKPLPTEPGLYVNRGELATYPSSASVLKRDFRDRWTFYGTPDGAEDIARVWHDAGELVRIVPGESEDGE